MNTKSFTLLETVLAAILAVIIMIASVGVIQNMQRETNRFKVQVDDDTTWMTANTHLAKMVRSSSYLEVLNDGNTLVLYNYNQSEKGRYVNNVADNSIDYMVDEGRTLRERYRNVRAAFSIVPNRQREGKDIEVRITYESPFVNVLNLRCAVNTMPLHSSSWIAVVTGYDTYEYDPDPNPTLYSVIPTVDVRGISTGYIAVGLVDRATDKQWGSSFCCMYIVKLDRYGKRVWSKDYGNCIDSRAEIAYGIIQTVDASGTPDGYMVSGMAGEIRSMSSIPDAHQLLVKLDLNGNVVWGYRFKVPNVNAETGVSLCQSFDSSRRPDGFVVLTCQPISFFGNGFFSLVKTDMNGRAVWAKAIKYKYGPNLTFPAEVKQTVGTNGKPDGYIIVGTEGTYPRGEPWLLKTNLNGDVLWFRKLATGFIYNKFTWVEQTFDDQGAIDGYIVGGRVSLDQRPGCVIRTTVDGNIVWTRNYLNGAMYTTDGSALYDKHGKLYGYITVSDQGVVVKLNLDGSVDWAQYRAGCSNSIYPSYDTEGVLDGYIACSYARSIYKIGKNGDISDRVTIEIDEKGKVTQPIAYTNVDLASIADIVEMEVGEAP